MVKVPTINVLCRDISDQFIISVLHFLAKYLSFALKGIYLNDS